MVCKNNSNDPVKPTPTWIWIIIGIFALFILILFIYVIRNVNNISNYTFKITETNIVDF